MLVQDSHRLGRRCIVPADDAACRRFTIETQLSEPCIPGQAEDDGGNTRYKHSGTRGQWLSRAALLLNPIYVTGS
jgi:hypothetical protein